MLNDGYKSSGDHFPPLKAETAWQLFDEVIGPDPEAMAQRNPDGVRNLIAYIEAGIRGEQPIMREVARALVEERK